MSSVYIEVRSFDGFDDDIIRKESIVAGREKESGRRVHLIAANIVTREV